MNGGGVPVGYRYRQRFSCREGDAVQRGGMDTPHWFKEKVRQRWALLKLPPMGNAGLMESGPHREVLSISVSGGGWPCQAIREEVQDVAANEPPGRSPLEWEAIANSLILRAVVDDFAGTPGDSDGLRRGHCFPVEALIDSPTERV